MTRGGEAVTPPEPSKEHPEVPSDDLKAVEDASAPKPHEVSLRRIRTRSIVMNSLSILLALAGIGWTARYFYHYYQYEITEDATVDQYMAPINARTNGFVKSVHFTEHQYVKAGEVLVVL